MTSQNTCLHVSQTRYVSKRNSFWLKSDPDQKNSIIRHSHKKGQNHGSLRMKQNTLTCHDIPNIKGLDVNRP